MSLQRKNILPSLILAGLVLMLLGRAESFASLEKERVGASTLSELPIVLPALGGEAVRSLGFDFASYPFVQQPWKDSSFPSLNLHWQELARGAIFEIGAETALQLTYHPAGQSAFFFEMTEAYVGTSKNLGAPQLLLGRKLQHWNQLDERWQFGIWQPRFRWDFIRPETVGLLGAFFSIKTPTFEWTLLGSPGFIPERGVPVTVENGEVISRSPWFLPPPNKVAILEEATPVEYSIILPPALDIVRHPGVSTMLRIGGETGHWLSAAYAYKPMNQLLLAYDGYLQLNGNGPEIAVATIFPRVVYHHLTSVEAGYQHPFFNAYVSVLHERPVPGEVPQQWTTQEVAPALGVSPTLDVLLGGSELEPARLELSYLRIWGGNAPDGGEFSSSVGSVFESRYPFDNALSVGLKSSLAALSPSLRRIHSHLRLLGDITNQGFIFSTEFRYQPRAHWQLALGADFLGSALPMEAPDEGANFIGRYRKNDRIHAGVTYVF